MKWNQEKKKNLIRFVIIAVIILSLLYMKNFQPTIFVGLFVSFLIVIPYFLTYYIIDTFYKDIKDKTKIDENYLKKYSFLIKRIYYTKYISGILLTALIITISYNYALTGKLDIYNLLFSVVSLDFGEDLSSLSLGIFVLFALFYSEILLWITLQHIRYQFYYYYVAKLYFLLIENTVNRYEKLKYLILGFNYYRKFILINLKLNIRDLNNYYYEFLNSDSDKSRINYYYEFLNSDSDNSHILNNIIDTCKKNNELGPLDEIVRFFKDKNINNYIIKTTFRFEFRDWITISTALIPLLIVLLEGYFGLLDISNDK
jgi:hypothetical protein